MNDLDYNKNILNYKDIQLTDMVYEEPKKIKNVSFMSLISYNKNPIIIQTPRLNCYSLIKTDTRCAIDLEFDKTHKEFFDFINNIDDISISKIQENSKQWFSQEFPLDVVEEFYKTPVKMARNKRPPSLKIRIPFSKGEPSCSVYNTENELIHFSDIKEDSKLIVVLKLYGLKFLKQQVIIEWIPLQIKTLQKVNIKKMKYMINDNLLTEDDMNQDNLLTEENANQDNLLTEENANQDNLLTEKNANQDNLLTEKNANQDNLLTEENANQANLLTEENTRQEDISELLIDESKIPNINVNNIKNAAILNTEVIDNNLLNTEILDTSLSEIPILESKSSNLEKKSVTILETPIIIETKEKNIEISDINNYSPDNFINNTDNTDNLNDNSLELNALKKMSNKDLNLLLSDNLNSSEKTITNLKNELLEKNKIINYLETQLKNLISHLKN